MVYMGKYPSAVQPQRYLGGKRDDERDVYDKFMRRSNDERQRKIILRQIALRSRLQGDLSAYPFTQLI